MALLSVLLAACGGGGDHAPAFVGSWLNTSGSRATTCNGTSNTEVSSAGSLLLIVTSPGESRLSITFSDPDGSSPCVVTAAAASDTDATLDGAQSCVPDSATLTVTSATLHRDAATLTLDADLKGPINGADCTTHFHELLSAKN